MPTKLEQIIQDRQALAKDQSNGAATAAAILVHAMFSTQDNLQNLIKADNAEAAAEAIKPYYKAMLKMARSVG